MHQYMECELWLGFFSFFLNLFTTFFFNNNNKYIFWVIRPFRRFFAFHSGRHVCVRNGVDVISSLAIRLEFSWFSFQCFYWHQPVPLSWPSPKLQNYCGIFWDLGAASSIDCYRSVCLRWWHSFLVILHRPKRSIHRRWRWVLACLAHSPDSKVSFAGPNIAAPHQCSHTSRMHRVAASFSPGSNECENVWFGRIYWTWVLCLLRWHFARYCRWRLEEYCRCAIDVLLKRKRNRIKNINETESDKDFHLAYPDSTMIVCPSFSATSFV